jgi:hypothetical protein
MFFALVVFSVSIVGGWIQVRPDSEYVQTVVPFLNDNFVKLLPEYKMRRTVLVVQSAKIQIVSGYNIHLVTNAGYDIIEFKMYVTPRQDIKLVDFSVTPSDYQMQLVGGWQICDADKDQEIVVDAVATYMKTKNIKTEMQYVLFLRTQVVAGLNIHVVYQDNEGITHSIVVYRTLSGQYMLKSADSF